MLPLLDRLDVDVVPSLPGFLYSELPGGPIAAALADSPVGLAAWIIDKYRAWSDCHGDLESVFDRDTLCTVLTLYWTTGSIGTSFRSYSDYRHNAKRPRIDVPVAVTLSHEPGMDDFPRWTRCA